MACQLGKKAGAKVFAIAGSDDKCAWLEKELGVDRAFNYKSPTFKTDFKEIGYLNAFFDNVGGWFRSVSWFKLDEELMFFDVKVISWTWRLQGWLRMHELRCVVCGVSCDVSCSSS